MDEIATKAVIIGVSILVTLIIVTVVIVEFSEIQRLYKTSSEIDVTFEERLNEFDKYRDSSNSFNGLDVMNTVKKYMNDKTVEVCIEQEPLLCEDITIEQEEYNKKYSSRLEEINGIYRIIFTKI